MIRIRRSRCTECQICMEICSWIHFGEINPKRSRIMVEADWPEKPSIRVCLSCKGHECVHACPRNALVWNQWIQVNEDLCDSCGECVRACPVQGIRLDPLTSFPLICDTCAGDFECVKWCPTQAIERMS